MNFSKSATRRKILHGDAAAWIRVKFERTETISEHEATKSKCPKCGSTKVSFVPGNVYVVTSKKS